jgi:tetraacyldisaccharide 4'-kinase
MKRLLHTLLLPFALLYGCVVEIRNLLFDKKLLPVKTFPLPVISVGNIAVGGTGKTPHTEYLIRLLRDDYKVGVLSRGYKRKRSGFVLADNTVTSLDIGDEPYQMWRKFPDITLAVDGKRVRGVRKLLELPDGQRPDVILLDDAFQHRYILPSLSILLMDYHRLLSDNCLLPAGRLREPAKNRCRAHILIVTKCPETIRPVDRLTITRQLNILPHQTLFFSSLQYGCLHAVCKDKDNPVPEMPLEALKAQDITVLLLTGIARPEPLIEKISQYTKNLKQQLYPDHHTFSNKELLEIAASFVRIDAERKIIITTEKDAARLASHPALPEVLQQSLYYLPVVVIFDNKDLFTQKIKEHVSTVKRNYRLDSRASSRNS